MKKRKQTNHLLIDAFGVWFGCGQDLSILSYQFADASNWLANFEISPGSFNLVEITLQVKIVQLN